MRSGETRLRHALRKHRKQPRTPLNPDPTSGFEIAVAQRLAAIDRDLDRIQARLNWLLTIIVGAAIGNVLLALLSS